MSKCAVEIVALSAMLAALAGAFPQARDPATMNEESTSPPFLQFTNGGIRLNFGGYHAEAGLGGLLGGTRTGGGLHVSAGAPSGAHASAGLGGLLGADDGSVGGGIQARAGLGNGGPEAIAGLGGSLNGSADNGNRKKGEIYADSTAGNWRNLRNDNERKNIQVIPRPAKTTDNQPASLEKVSDEGTVLKKMAAVAKSSAAPSNFSATIYLGRNETNNRKIDNNLPHEVAIGDMNILEGLYPGAKSLAEPLRSNGKSKIDAASAETASDSTADDEPSNYKESRFQRRKRLRAAARKQFYDNTGDVTGASSRGVSTRLDPDGSADSSRVGPPHKGGSFFDDIFNIPISALNAVNQLLKNNVG